MNNVNLSIPLLTNNSHAKVWNFLDAMDIGRSQKTINLSEKTDLDEINKKYFSNVNLMNQEVKTDTIKSIPDISCPC